MKAKRATTKTARRRDSFPVPTLEWTMTVEQVMFQRTKDGQMFPGLLLNERRILDYTGKIVPSVWNWRPVPSGQRVTFQGYPK